jgi:hypothetical protein
MDRQEQRIRACLGFSSFSTQRKRSAGVTSFQVSGPSAKLMPLSVRMLVITRETQFQLVTFDSSGTAISLTTIAASWRNFDTACGLIPKSPLMRASGRLDNSTATANGPHVCLFVLLFDES